MIEAFSLLCQHCRRDLNSSCPIRDQALIVSRFSVDLGGYPSEWRLTEAGKPRCQQFVPLKAN